MFRFASAWAYGRCSGPRGPRLLIAGSVNSSGVVKLLKVGHRSTGGSGMMDLWGGSRCPGRSQCPAGAPEAFRGAPGGTSMGHLRHLQGVPPGVASARIPPGSHERLRKPSPQAPCVKPVIAHGCRPASRRNREPAPHPFPDTGAGPTQMNFLGWDPMRNSTAMSQRSQAAQR